MHIYVCVPVCIYISKVVLGSGNHLENINGQQPWAVGDYLLIYTDRD